jgi:transcriptional regulator NrdR family protein
MAHIDVTECPKCLQKTGVMDSRTYSGALRRRRRCGHCNHRFSTTELPDDVAGEIVAILDTMAALRSAAQTMERAVIPAARMHEILTSIMTYRGG